MLAERSTLHFTCLVCQHADRPVCLSSGEPEARMTRSESGTFENARKTAAVVLPQIGGQLVFCLVGRIIPSCCARRFVTRVRCKQLHFVTLQSRADSPVLYLYSFRAIEQRELAPLDHFQPRDVYSQVARQLDGVARSRSIRRNKQGNHAK